MNERELIVDILYRVIHKGAYASLLMRGVSHEKMGIVSETVYGTIRNFDLLESQWRHLVKNVRKRTAVILDFSVYQLFFLDRVQPYTVINEAVSLAEKSEKKFVNAVLRQVQRHGLVMPEGDSDEELALRYSHPLFLVKMWKAQYGREQMLKILASDQSRPVSFGRINRLKAGKQNPDGLEMVGEDAFILRGSPAALPGFGEGKLLAQDLHSQQVVRLLAPLPGERILDLCAAPGTKTQQMADLMHNEGEIIACDLYPARVKLIEELMERTGVTIVSAAVNDGTVFQPAFENGFDRVLLDAPCSGLGDLAHKPEIRLHVKPEDLDAIQETQRQLLANAARYVRPGGVLLYSTCTLNRKENEKQGEWLVKNESRFTLQEEATLFPDKCDGFYAALLKKE